MNTDASNEKFIEFQCPHCRTSVSFRAVCSGTPQECPHCSKVFVVPVDGSRIGRILKFPIVTPRLKLRPLTLDDIENWLKFVTDEETYKYLRNYPPTKQDVMEWWKANETVRFDSKRWTLFLAIEAGTAKILAGTIFFSINFHEPHCWGDFEIMIHPAFRARGYGTEAVKAMIDFGFHQFALHDIRVAVDMRNIPGRRMLERAGMKLEGEFVEDYFVKCEWTSNAYYVAFPKASPHRG